MTRARRHRASEPSGSSASTKRMQRLAGEDAAADAGRELRARLDWGDGRCELRLPLGHRGEHAAHFGRSVPPTRERAQPRWWPNLRAGLGAELVAQAPAAARAARPPRARGAPRARSRPARRRRGRRPAGGSARRRPARPARGGAAASSSPARQQVRVALPALARAARQRAPPARARPARASVGSSSSPDSKRWMRSLRCAQLAGASAGRAASARSAARARGRSRPSAWSSRCLYLTERAVDQLASVVHLRRAEPVERGADRGLVVVDHRIAVGRLVARQPQRVQRERVLVGRRALLLDQAGHHADLDGVRFHGARSLPATSG